MPRTKMNLGYAFIRLLEKQKIKDITIGDICLEGNYSRETFYYHFENKQHLIEWMHFFQKHSYFERYFGQTSFTNIVAMIIKDMSKVKIFYYRAFEDIENSHIDEIMINQTIKIYREMAEHALNTNKLSAELKMSIYYSVYGSVGIVKEWFLDNHEMNEDELAVFITDAMNDDLKKIFLNYKK